MSPVAPAWAAGSPEQRRGPAQPARQMGDTVYIRPEELHRRLAAPEVRVVDVRADWDEQDGRAAWAAGHIPGAGHADWVRDWGVTRDEVEGMLPGSDEFAETLSRLGIGNDTFVVAYDDNRIFTASRFVWALLEHGHTAAAVLDGGYPGWLAAGFPVSTGEEPSPAPRTYSASAGGGLYRSMADVRALLGRDDVDLVDCRMDSTYASSGGHIPGARRLPAPDLVGDDGFFRDASEVLDLAGRIGLSPDREAVLYCGGGVSASAVFVALRQAGFTRLAVYDGSWSQWSRYPENPVERH